MFIILSIFLVFILGAAIGSFLNVLILRQSAGASRRQHSVCLSCGERLRARDLFPIISFFILGGRCRHCKCRVSWQYPLVEITTGVLFLLSFLHGYQLKPFWLGIFDGITLAVICSAAIVIFVYDLRHKIIIDASAIIISVMAISRVLVLHSGDFGSSIFWLDLASGIFAALPFFLIWFFSRGKWIGLGDAKLMLGLGWFLGWSLWLGSIILAFWAGAGFAILLMFFQKADFLKGTFRRFRIPTLGLKTEIPFGPFLIIAALVSFFFNINILSVVMGFLM